MKIFYGVIFGTCYRIDRGQIVQAYVWVWYKVMRFNKKVLFKVTESINYCLITGQGDMRLRKSFTLHSTHKVFSMFTYFGVNVSIFCFIT